MVYTFHLVCYLRRFELCIYRLFVVMKMAYKDIGLKLLTTLGFIQNIHFGPSEFYSLKVQISYQDLLM